MSRQLEPNSTQTPDVIFDEWLPLLTANEAKVVFFVVRKTYGWGKRHERLGAAQIVAGTGMARSTVFSACASLEAVGVLLVKHGERGGSTNDYALNVGKADTATAALYARSDAPVPKAEPSTRPRPNAGLGQSSTRTRPNAGLVRTADSPSPNAGLALDRTAVYSKKQGRDKEETNDTNVSLATSPPTNETPKRVKFVAPTLEEITADFAAKGRGDLAAEWYGYWDSRDWWRAKGIRMSKWKSAVSGWIASKTAESGQPLTSRRFPAAVIDTSQGAMIGRTLDAIRGM